MRRGKEQGCSFVVMSACNPRVRQEENATRLRCGLGVALAGVVILAVVGVKSAGAQTPKTPEAVTANVPPVCENIDALQSAAKRGSCGNGVCNAKETCSTCPADCGVCPPVCGDGTCNGTETCSTCPTDCGVCPPVCGDGTCNGTETCSTCPTDCGVCPPVCGDGTCNGTETCSTCTTDCGQCPGFCGDGVCSVGEGCGGCPIDCGTCPPPSVCSSDADCVPATCCHAAACVPLVQAPSCGGACDGGCNPFTMDCGQGYCACQNGQCTAVIFAELLNADGPVATNLSSDPAVTSPELAAPTNLSALGSQGQIDISWEDNSHGETGFSWEDNSHGETGFEVHRSPTGAPNSFILLETVGINGTAFSNSGLTLDEHFCYQVRAFRKGTSTTTYSEFSNIACTTAAPGTTIDRRVPEAVAGGLAFFSVDAGFRHTCGRAITGTVYCWGANGAGQLGNNSNSLSTVPAKVFGQP
jgi:Regulator of chromosome condensation (RCC1) repeat